MPHNRFMGWNSKKGQDIYKIAFYNEQNGSQVSEHLNVAKARET